MKKALIIGGGVSGCTSAHCLRQKGFDVTVLEKEPGVGGMSRTYFYHGHPYEFGPHVWFWPKDRENKLVYDLSEDGMYEVDRKLYTYTEDGLFRYPIHFEDAKKILTNQELVEDFGANRNTYTGFNLFHSQLPKIGKCKFSEYFEAAIGKILYGKFMKEYTHKMWGIPGDELETTMVWADRMKDQDNDIQYDPIKFEDHNLGKGLSNWYPKSKKGWNVVWENMIKDCHVFSNFSTTDRIVDLDLKKWDIVICTLAPDTFWGADILPANGRLVVPLLVPGNSRVYPQGTESIHYADNSPITRSTEMKTITRHNSPDSLILIEIPIDGTKEDVFPTNIMIPRHYAKRCYYRQTQEAFAQYKLYVDAAKEKFPNLYFAGRHGCFKYWGMPEVVQNAIETVENL